MHEHLRQNGFGYLLAVGVTAVVTGIRLGFPGLVDETGPFLLFGVAVLHAWMANPRDLPAALAAVIRCGGDTDTVAAIVGAIVGAGVGKAGIPARLLDDLWDWPRGPAWMEDVARRAAQAAEQRVRMPARFISPLSLLARNAVFLVLVLGHGFRRLAPPY